MSSNSSNKSSQIKFSQNKNKKLEKSVEKTINIFLNASELSIAIGVNPYQSVKDLIVRLWSKNFAEDYYRLLDEIKNANQIEIIQETEYQCLQRLSQLSSNQLKVKESIQKCLDGSTTQSVEDLQKNQKDLLDEIKKDSNLSSVDKVLLTETLVSMSNKRFGVRKEGDSIEEYEKLTGKTVKRIGKYYTEVINISHLPTAELLPGVVWKFGGKIDGLTTENELIEVKNRVRAFFDKIKEYEKVQIQTYLFLLKLEKGYLVESLVKNKGEVPKINVVATEFDSIYWNEFLMPRAYKFIDFFHQIMFDDDYKMRLLIQDDIEMERELKGVLFKE
jgi:hypothetical protein